jgi:hypothetical protein
MPSGEHESPIVLIQSDPTLAAWLLAHLFKVTVPDFDHARQQPTEVRVLVPRTYHADGVLLYCDADDRPVMGVVVEVQRGWDPDKRWTWKLYVCQVEAESQVETLLLIYCLDPAVARRYRELFERDGSSVPLRPYLFTPADVPLVIDAELAREAPALAVLSALCHGADPQVDGVFPALAEALRALGPGKAILYYDIVLAGLPAAARTRWEAFMTATTGSEYRSELFREIDAHGRAEGKAQGEAQAVLTVLDARGVPVSDAIREEVLACTDLDQLDTWLRRAVTAATAEQVTAA